MHVGKLLSSAIRGDWLVVGTNAHCRALIIALCKKKSSTRVLDCAFPSDSDNKMQWADVFEPSWQLASADPIFPMELVPGSGFADKCPGICDRYDRISLGVEVRK